MFVVTIEFIEQNTTEAGAWNFAQLTVLGEPWPPVHGWKQRAVGRKLTDEDAALFVSYGANPPGAKERKSIRKAAKDRVNRTDFVKKVQTQTVLPLPDDAVKPYNPMREFGDRIRSMK